jgi:hypothetical protein
MEPAQHARMAERKSRDLEDRDAVKRLMMAFWPLRWKRPDELGIVQQVVSCVVCNEP